MNRNRIRTFLAAALIAGASVAAHAAPPIRPASGRHPRFRLRQHHYLPDSAFKPQPGHTYNGLRTDPGCHTACKVKPGAGPRRAHG